MKNKLFTKDCPIKTDKERLKIVLKTFCPKIKEICKGCSYFNPLNLDSAVIRALIEYRPDNVEKEIESIFNHR